MGKKYEGFNEVEDRDIFDECAEFPPNIFVSIEKSTNEKQYAVVLKGSQSGQRILIGGCHHTFGNLILNMIEALRDAGRDEEWGPHMIVLFHVAKRILYELPQCDGDEGGTTDASTTIH